MTLSRILSWRPGGYLKSSGELLTWLLLRALAQVITILLLTRHLGADGYGLFVAILAISSLFSPLAGLGLHGILLRNGARNPADLPKLLGATLALWWPSTLAFSSIAFFLAALSSPSSIPVIFLLAFVFSEITSSSLVELIGRVEQAQHRTRTFGALQAGLSLFRLAGLLVCTLINQTDTSDWINAYTVSSLAYGGAAFLWVKAKYRPCAPEKRDWLMARDGIPFMVGALSFRLQGEFNKPILAQLGYSQTGNFSAAQRMVDLASLPLTALQETLWPRYFANNTSRQRTWLASIFLVTLALLGGIFLAVGAPLLPKLLGADFEHSASLLIYLAWLPVFQVVRNLMNAVIISKNRQSYLMWVYAACGIASIISNSLLIQKAGLFGAILSAYLVEVLAILILSTQILYLRNSNHAI